MESCNSVCVCWPPSHGAVLSRLTRVAAGSARAPQLHGRTVSYAVSSWRARGQRALTGSCQSAMSACWWGQFPHLPWAGVQATSLSAPNLSSVKQSDNGTHLVVRGAEGPPGKGSQDRVGTPHAPAVATSSLGWDPILCSHLVIDSYLSSRCTRPCPFSLRTLCCGHCFPFWH